MSSLDGRDVLKRLDRVIADARRALTDAIRSEEDAGADLAEIRRETARAYAGLAELQLAAVEDGADLAELDRLDAEIDDLMAAQTDFVDKLLAELERLADAISRSEAERGEAAEALDQAVEAYETRVAEIEARLEKDEAYTALVIAANEADATVERAEQKLALARDDREEKGEPYRADPLFMYLWKRRFRTPDYRAPPFIRVLDGWVARLCNYDRAYRNYQRLTELPEMLAEHLQRLEARADAAEAALSAAETEALEAGGANALKAKADEKHAAIARLDEEIAEREDEHLALAERHAAAQRGEAGPATEARNRLAQALKAAGFPDLRVLASQTVTAEDDALVDRLVTLRKEEMSLELRLDDLAEAPRARQRDLDRLERVRRGFKAARMDSPYARFKASTLDSVLAGLLSGRSDADGALRELRRRMRRREPRTHPRFGGEPRASTLGLPGIAREIGWEILKEVARQSGGRSGPWRMPSRRRGRGTSFPMPRFPSGGGRRGGFKTGGGF